MSIVRITLLLLLILIGWQLKAQQPTIRIETVTETELLDGAGPEFKLNKN